MVDINALGKCEHCGDLANMEELPMDAMDSKWKCTCGGELGPKSFGMKEKDGKWKRVRWVGPTGEWVEDLPIKGFTIGDLNVTVHELLYW